MSETENENELERLRALERRHYKDILKLRAFIGMLIVDPTADKNYLFACRFALEETDPDRPLK